MIDPNSFKIKTSNEREHSYVTQQIYKYNTTHVPIPPGATMFEYIRFCMHSPKHGVAGGIAALLIWGYAVNIDILWVADEYRGQGFGSELLNSLERHCFQLGAGIIQVDTFEFQALEFYQKNGYVIFGELADCPTPGHIRYYLSKKLTP